MERRLPDAEMHAMIPTLKDAFVKCLKKHEDSAKRSDVIAAGKPSNFTQAC